MQVPDLVGLFVAPLENLEIPYMITGGVASVIYGDPRFTRDIDIVLRLNPEDSERLAAAFGAAEFYVPPVETLRAEVRRDRHGHFNIIHRDSALKADMYLPGNDPLHAWAFERRQRLALDQLDIWLAPVEYVIIRKLEYYLAGGSDRHLRDVTEMLRISGPLVDRAAIAEWVERQGLQEAWRNVAHESPE